MTVKFANVSNPTVFGVEWTHEDSGSRYQLSNIRGTYNLMFGCLPAGKTEWMTTSVFAPERFGMDTPPSTFKQFAEIARRYVEG